MKLMRCLLLSMICILLTSCGNENKDIDKENVIEETNGKEQTEDAGELQVTGKDENSDKTTDFSFEDLKRTEFVFSSGAGAWRTVMTIGTDGSFEGEYSDSDMGATGEGYSNGTVYYCKFSGQLSELTKVDELTYTAKLINISYENTIGAEECKNGVRYIYADAYGLDDAQTIYFYLPGTKKESLSEECLSWVSQAMYDENNNSEEELDFVCLYNAGGEEAFYSYDRVKQFIENLRYYEEQEQYYLAELDKLTTQAELTENAGYRYELWDMALNEEWKILMSILSEAEKEKVRKEEREWITYKDREVKAAGKEAEGGSMQPMLEYDKGAELTKARVYELKDLFP